MESESTGKTDKADELEVIEEAIKEAERDNTEATDLLSGTETKNEEARNENEIHPALHVPTVEHTHNLRRRKYPRPDYTNRFGFLATIIHCVLTLLDRVLSSSVPDPESKSMTQKSNRVPCTQFLIAPIHEKPQFMTDKCHTVRRLKRSRKLIMSPINHA